MQSSGILTDTHDTIWNKMQTKIEWKESLNNIPKLDILEIKTNT